MWCALVLTVTYFPWLISFKDTVDALLEGCRLYWLAIARHAWAVCHGRAGVCVGWWWWKEGRSRSYVTLRECSELSKQFRGGKKTIRWLTVAVGCSSPFTCRRCAPSRFMTWVVAVAVDVECECTCVSPRTLCLHAYRHSCTHILTFSHARALCQSLFRACTTASTTTHQTGTESSSLTLLLYV